MLGGARSLLGVSKPKRDKAYEAAVADAVLSEIGSGRTEAEVKYAIRQVLSKMLALTKEVERPMPRVLVVLTNLGGGSVQLTARVQPRVETRVSTSPGTVTRLHPRRHKPRA